MNSPGSLSSAKPQPRTGERRGTVATKWRFGLAQKARDCAGPNRGVVATGSARIGSGSRCSNPAMVRSDVKRGRESGRLEESSSRRRSG